MTQTFFLPPSEFKKVRLIPVWEMCERDLKIINHLQLFCICNQGTKICRYQWNLGDSIILWACCTFGFSVTACDVHIIYYLKSSKQSQGMACDVHLGTSILILLAVGEEPHFYQICLLILPKKIALKYSKVTISKVSPF